MFNFPSVRNVTLVHGDLLKQRKVARSTESQKQQACKQKNKIQMQIKRCARKYAKVSGKKKIQMKEEPFLHTLHYPMNMCCKNL